MGNEKETHQPINALDEIDSQRVKFEQQETDVMVKGDNYYLGNYGLTLSEVSQEVQYGDEVASLADVIEKHAKCPVGPSIRKAFQEGLQESNGDLEIAREKSISKVRGWGEMVTGFDVIFETPLQIAEKKN